MSVFNGLFFGLTVLIGIGMYLVLQALNAPGNVQLLFWIQYVIFALITFLTVVFGFRAIKAKAFSQFQAVFFSSILAKLILAGTVALISKSIYPEGGTIMAVPIAIAYVPYLCLEVYYLLRFSKQQMAAAKEE